MRLRRAISALVGLAIVAGAIYVLLEPVAVFGYDDGSLAESLEGEIPDDYGEAECRETGPGWTCFVELAPGRGPGAAYTVAVDDEGCWTAAPVPFGGEPPAPTGRLAACVDLLDVAGLSGLGDA